MANTWSISNGGIFQGSDGNYPAPHDEYFRLAKEIISAETLGIDCHAVFHYVPEQFMVREDTAKSKGISLDKMVAIEYRINEAIRALR